MFGVVYSSICNACRHVLGDVVLLPLPVALKVPVNRPVLFFILFLLLMLAIAVAAIVVDG